MVAGSFECTLTSFREQLRSRVQRDRWCGSGALAKEAEDRIAVRSTKRCANPAEQHATIRERLAAVGTPESRTHVRECTHESTRRYLQLRSGHQQVCRRLGERSNSASAGALIHR